MGRKVHTGVRDRRVNGNVAENHMRNVSKIPFQSMPNFSAPKLVNTVSAPLQPTIQLLSSARNYGHILFGEMRSIAGADRLVGTPIESDTFWCNYATHPDRHNFGFRAPAGAVSHPWIGGKVREEATSESIGDLHEKAMGQQRQQVSRFIHSMTRRGWETLWNSCEKIELRISAMKNPPYIPPIPMLPMSAQ